MQAIIFYIFCRIIKNGVNNDLIRTAFSVCPIFPMRCSIPLKASSIIPDSFLVSSIIYMGWSDWIFWGIGDQGRNQSSDHTSENEVSRRLEHLMLGFSKHFGT